MISQYTEFSGVIWCWLSVFEVFRFAVGPDVGHRLDSRCQISDETLELRLIARNEIRCWISDQLSHLTADVGYEIRCQISVEMSGM